MEKASDMLKIWGRANSTNVKKILWVVEELDLVYQRIDAGGAFGVVNDPAFRVMNPNGLVPVLEDGDVVLWESNTILRYLAARYGDAGFNPVDPVARAQAEKWMDWVTSTIATPFRDVFWGMIRTPAADRDMAKSKRRPRLWPGIFLSSIRCWPNRIICPARHSVLAIFRLDASSMPGLKCRLTVRITRISPHGMSG